VPLSITLIHSFTTDTPYEVFVSLSGDNGDVYAGQCTLGKSLILMYFEITTIINCINLNDFPYVIG